MLENYTSLLIEFGATVLLKYLLDRLFNVAPPTLHSGSALMREFSLISSKKYIPVGWLYFNLIW